jgi:hypothetical protein
MMICGTVGRSFADLAVSFSQHPDEYRPQRPILLAVDQQLGKGATLRVAPELPHPVGPLEVGQHEDVEQFGAGSGAERVEALPKSAFELVGSHGRRLRRRTVGPRAAPADTPSVAPRLPSGLHASRNDLGELSPATGWLR